MNSKREAAADVCLLAVLDVTLRKAQEKRSWRVSFQLPRRLVIGNEAVDEPITMIVDKMLTFKSVKTSGHSLVLPFFAQTFLHEVHRGVKPLPKLKVFHEFLFNESALRYELVSQCCTVHLALP